MIERWVQIRLKTDAGGSIPAREAYADFCRWARSAGIEPCTETRFGRFLSARIVQLGGNKMKKRDRAYYQGVMFKKASGDLERMGAKVIAAVVRRRPMGTGIDVDAAFGQEPVRPCWRARRRAVR